MYVQSMYSIYKVWIVPLINTKNIIVVQQIVYEALCNCAMGYFTSIFVGVEMAQMVKAQVRYARRLGSEFDPPWIKTKYFSFNYIQ